MHIICRSLHVMFNLRILYFVFNSKFIELFFHFCFCTRLVIWACLRWNAKHLSQVVCGEHFHGWHQSFWMEAVVLSLIRCVLPFVIWYHINRLFFLTRRGCASILFFNIGWRVLIWYRVVGTSNRGRTIRRLALWGYYRYGSSCTKNNHAAFA